jgi:uncharacterized protein YbjT (DUF2867 family)
VDVLPRATNIDGVHPRKILVTGATGYIGGRLAPTLLALGHTVRVLARTPAKLGGVEWATNAEIVAGDAENESDAARALRGIHTAFYLLHSIGTGKDFHEREIRTATAFARAARDGGVEQIVFLGGLAGDDATSEHLRSRHDTGKALRSTGIPVLELRAGIILGSGSLSFEMLRYLTEHLPVMVTPRWVSNRTQPIAVADVLFYLAQSAELPEPVDAVLDVGGKDQLTYADMIRRYAVKAGLRRRIILPVPVLTPRISSLWIGTVTPIPRKLAAPIVDSLANETVARDDHDPAPILGSPAGGVLGFEDALERAFHRQGGGGTPTRWSDAGSFSPWETTATDPSWSGGSVHRDIRTTTTTRAPGEVWPFIERIGGRTGWYGFDWAWKTRGFLDRLVGGVGLRRGRRDDAQLRVGDALDFWHVVHGERLVLRAEMRLPGEALLEFRITPTETGSLLEQCATFRPRSIAGHIYWFAMLPVHAALFPRMLANIRKAAERGN